MKSHLDFPQMSVYFGAVNWLCAKKSEIVLDGHHV